jgi:N-acetyl-anhydromuramoyl-L-alanine amidase
MKVIDNWLDCAERVFSPNYNARPSDEDISLIVIHCISLPPGEFGGNTVTQLFTNALDSAEHPYFNKIDHLRVSAHLFIRRTGEIIQYVPFHRRAWHAGVSSYGGRVDCNDFSIGIELEGTGHMPYTEEQYAELAELIQALLACYPSLSPERITGHSTISPGRKQDPGDSFDWEKLYRLLEEKNGRTASPALAASQ